VPKAIPFWGIFLLIKLSWRVIYIEESDYLSLYLDNIKIKKGLDETTIPLSDINSIIIDNYTTTLSVSLINKCMDYKVNIVTCDNYHLPNSIILPYSGNYQSAFQLRKQINWDKQVLEIMWQYLIKAKINNQIMILKHLKKNSEVINKLTLFLEEVELNDKTNREGLSAKMYFRELYGKDFKRHAEDTVNAALNYGYSILRSQISRALVARGLNPHLGIFHRGASNAFNLADDFIEVYRPIVDCYVYQNITNESAFIRENRLDLIKLTTKKIKFDGQKQTITNTINLMIDAFLNTIETGEIEKLMFPEPIIYDL